MCPEGVNAFHNGRETRGGGLPQQAARASPHEAGVLCAATVRELRDIPLKWST